MDLLIVLLVIPILAVGIVREYNPQALLILAGIALFLLAEWTGLGQIEPKSPTGFIGFDLFAKLSDIFKNRMAGLGLLIMATGGFSAYMSKIGASQALVRLAIKPASILRDPYKVVALCYLIGVGLSLFINSATGLGLLLMATLYPTMVKMGVSPASAAAVIASPVAFEIGPTEVNVIAAASKSGIEVLDYVFRFQLRLVIPMVITATLLHYFWQKRCDRKERVVGSGLTEEVESESDSGLSVSTVPIYYAFLPLLPFLFLVVFSPLLVTSVHIDIFLAMTVSVFIGIALEIVFKRSIRKALSPFTEFLRGMGGMFASVVTLIVAAEYFAESLKSLGAIDTMIGWAHGVGMGAGMMQVVLVTLIVLAALMTGSGNASFLSLAAVAPDVSRTLGVPAVTMLLPMQLASGIGRTMSPISAVVIACAGIAAIKPTTLIARTMVPMLGSLLVAIVLNYFLFIS